ncbi:MAG: hypothetical protein ACLGG3_01170, partial [Alphaproteobacteria bacterium]
MTDAATAVAGDTRQLDPLAREFTGGRFALFDLYRANVQSGGGAVLEGRVFTDCVIEGPAVTRARLASAYESTSSGRAPGESPSW